MADRGPSPPESGADSDSSWDLVEEALEEVLGLLGLAEGPPTPTVASPRSLEAARQRRARAGRIHAFEWVAVLALLFISNARFHLFFSPSLSLRFSSPHLHTSTRNH